MSVSKDAYAKQKAARYTGKTDTSQYQEYGAGQQAVGKVGERLKLAGSESGQKELLKGLAGENYTSGLQNLDQFILGSGTQGKQSIADMQGKYGNTASSWADLNNSLNNDIIRAQEASFKTAEDTGKAWADAFGGAQSTLKGRETEAVTQSGQRKATVDQGIAGLASKDRAVQAKAIKDLGLNPYKAQVEYMLANGVSPESIVSYTGDLKLGNVASQDEMNRYAALAELEGKPLEFSFDKNAEANLPFRLDNDKISKGGQLQMIKSKTINAAAEKQRERDMALSILQNKITRGVYDDQVAQATGLTQEEFNAARGGKYLGSDVAGIKLTPGTRVNAGDVATAEQRTQWDALRRELGLNDTFSVQDSQDEGNPFTANTDAVRQSVRTAKAAAAARQAEQDKKTAEEIAAIMKRRDQEEFGDLENAPQDFKGRQRPDGVWQL
jgi:hypothetical protein